MKRSWGGEVQNVSVLVAIGVNNEGYREILGVAEGSKEDSESWRQFLRYMRERGLERIKLVISDKSLGLLEALGEFYPKAKWQRCVVHFYRNVLNAVPKGKAKEVALMLKAIHMCPANFFNYPKSQDIFTPKPSMSVQTRAQCNMLKIHAIFMNISVVSRTVLKAIHAQEDKSAARQKAGEVVKKLQSMKLDKASRIVGSGCDETLSYYDFPSAHWRNIRTNNPLERLNREIRRRTRVVGSFPDGQSALMLVAARLRYMAGQKWGTERYMNMKQEITE